MIVVKKVNSLFKKEDKKLILKGIKCMWFSNDGIL